jgi:nucleotide-binding universal stress UspA family protein
MFQKLLLAVDDSEESQKAAELTKALAGQFGSEVLVLHVRETIYSGASAWSPEWTPDLQLAMSDFVKEVEGQGQRARIEILDAARGHAGKVIAEAAEEEGADVIVMGSRGRSRAAAVVLGSVAGSVLHNASRPVLVAR